MKASDVMDPNPSVVKPTDVIETAVEMIMSHRYRSVPVVDDNGCYVGMFGVNCLLKQVIPSAVFLHGLENVSFIHESLEDLYHRYDAVKKEPLSICMAQEIKSVGPDTPLTDTMLQLYETRLSIPVVDPASGKLLGMISYFDVGHKILEAGKNQHA